MKGQIYLHEYNYPEAIKLFDKAIEVDPSYEDSYINKIYCLYLQKNYKECIEFATKVQTISQIPQTFPGISGMLQHNDGTGKAIEYLKKAHELNPKDVGILTSIAWEYYSLEDYAKHPNMPKRLPKYLPMTKCKVHQGKTGKSKTSRSRANS